MSNIMISKSFGKSKEFLKLCIDLDCKSIDVNNPIYFNKINIGNYFMNPNNINTIYIKIGDKEAIDILHEKVEIINPKDIFILLHKTEINVCCEECDIYERGQLNYG